MLKDRLYGTKGLAVMRDFLMPERRLPMITAITVAIITGGFALLGTWLTVRSGNLQVQADLAAHERVQDERIKNLTEEVRKHNGFAEKIPRLDQRVISLEKTVFKNHK